MRTFLEAIEAIKEGETIWGEEVSVSNRILPNSNKRTSEDIEIPLQMVKEIDSKYLLSIVLIFLIDDGSRNITLSIKTNMERLNILIRACNHKSKSL